MLNKRIAPLPQAIMGYIPFRGGLDLVTPTWDTQPGTCKDAQNYEIGINGGYDRILGYERFDGRSKPSDAEYGTVDVTITGSISVGDTITGATSGATAVVVAVVLSEDPNYLVVTKISGTFVSETLNVSGSPEGTITEAPAVNGASSNLLHAQYNNLAADEYRNDIAAVPGSGSILGLWILSDTVYAVRNNAGGTAAAIYQSSASGWTAVSLGRELSFTSGGTTEISEGDTITGATSGATAVLTRVTLESGSWGGGDAEGRFIFASQTGTFQSENIDVGGNTNLATIAGDSDAITLLPDGRFETVRHNFGGLAGAKRIYGCDGVNRGFEFDGTVFVPIDTGMTTDTPTHVGVNKNHLFFSFEGSAQHSAIGDPYSWSVVLGSGELAVGDDITAFKRKTGDAGQSAFIIASRNSYHILYGNSSSDWNLIAGEEEVGAYAYSVQTIGGMTLMLDDRGVTTMQSTDRFGNFATASISRLIQPWVNARRQLITASCIMRDKNQYRLFFSDGRCLAITLDGPKVLGMFPLLFDDHATCVISEEDSSGDEVVYFGSDNGFVYQMEKGTSFDGEDIAHHLILHPVHFNSPRITKAYKDCAIEISGDGYATFDFSYELGYNVSTIPQPAQETTEVPLSVPFWDAFTWDAFTWDGITLSPSSLHMGGTAQNVAVVIRGSSDYESAVKMSGVIVRYIPRRQLRI